MFNKKVAVLFSALTLVAGSAYAAFSCPIAPAFGQVMMAPTPVPVIMPAAQSSFAVTPVIAPQFKILSIPQFRFDTGPGVSLGRAQPSEPVNYTEETNEAISWIFILGGLTVIIKGLASMFKPATTLSQRLGHISVGVALVVIGVAVPMLWVVNINEHALSSIGCG